MCQGCHQPQWAPLMKSRRSTTLSRQRSAEPEIFTFDPIPAAKRTPAANLRLRGKRRAVKVLYPTQVRKYLPAEKKDWAKRLFLLFLSVVVVQVYSATEVNEEAANAVAAAGAPASVKPELSGKWALEVAASSEEPFVPGSGLAPQLPNPPATGADGTNPAATNPREIVACYRMMHGPTACRM